MHHPDKPPDSGVHRLRASSSAPPRASDWTGLSATAARGWLALTLSVATAVFATGLGVHRSLVVFVLVLVVLDRAVAFVFGHHDRPAPRGSKDARVPPGAGPLLLALLLAVSSSASAQEGCTGDRAEVVRCRRELVAFDLEDDLLIADQELAASAHADDTAGARLLGSGLVVFAAGFVGTFVRAAMPPCPGGRWSGGLFSSSNGCRADEPWALIETTIAIAGTGILSAVVGIIWLSVNGAPYRARDRILRRLERVEDRLDLDASLSPEGGTLAMTLAF